MIGRKDFEVNGSSRFSKQTLVSKFTHKVKCEFCGKQFKNSNSLSSHRRAYHRYQRSSNIFETGNAVNDYGEKSRFVKLDRFCSVHEDGSIYVPAEITTYYELVHLGLIEYEFREYREWIEA